jgi:hypothetical protein
MSAHSGAAHSNLLMGLMTTVASVKAEIAAREAENGDRDANADIAPVQNVALCAKKADCIAKAESAEAKKQSIKDFAARLRRECAAATTEHAVETEYAGKKKNSADCKAQQIVDCKAAWRRECAGTTKFVVETESGAETEWESAKTECESWKTACAVTTESAAAETERAAGNGEMKSDTNSVQRYVSVDGMEWMYGVSVDGMKWVSSLPVAAANGLGASTYTGQIHTHTEKPHGSGKSSWATGMCIMYHNKRHNNRHNYTD